MNKFYKSIWNHSIDSFIAVSELANSGGRKTASGSSSIATSGVRFPLRTLAAAMLLATGSNAWALPVGGEVSAGSASISGGATEMTITQGSQNAAINWQAFDIASGETVNFAQPNSSATVLNRVLGSDPSSILGSLNANGNVFLINPNGVLFGQSASVNVGGLVASTLSLSDSDFMAGHYSFAGTGDGSIVNQGTINADGGYIALLGANVSNQGTLQANLGTVALAAGDAITLDVAGDGLLNVAVSQGALDALAQNGGMIQADGGKVLMTAQSAGELFQSAVNNTGVIRAQSIDNRNGTIMLMGDMQSGTVNIGGSLDVSGTDAGETGGSVIASARHVGLYDAVIDASGDAGGGSVLIGGGYQGKDPSVQNAKAAYMSAGSTINADAITSGDGGTVVVWADDSTRAYGSITARGGAESGNGGLIETSGGWLDVSGIRIDTRAPNGAFGMWLLDPAEITISDAATSGATETDNVFAPDSGVNEANINVDQLNGNLVTSNITVTTENSGASGTGSGDINVNAAIEWTALSTSPTTLTLNADRDININEAITGTWGSLIANAERDVNVDAALTFTDGDFTAIAGQNVNMSAATTVTRGDAILIADNDGTGPGDINGGTVDFNCAAPPCITVTEGTLGVRFNPVSYTTTQAEIDAYDLTLTGASAVLDAKAWVFGLGDDKVYDGLRNATVSGLEPDINGVQSGAELGTTSNALFDTKDVGDEKPITYQANSFTDDSGFYDLFAPFGTAEGTYFTRADITPAPLTITANDGSKVFGETFPLSPQAFTSEGLVNAETVDSVSLTSDGAVATASVDGSPYAITPTDATGGTFSTSNYAITYVDGALFVSATSADPSDPTPTDPRSTDPKPTDPSDLLAPELATLPPESVYLLAKELAGEARRPDTSSVEEKDRTFLDALVYHSEGLELTFATAAVNMPTSQLERVEPLPESGFVTPPRDTYVPPVYAPRQDRF
ncbi:filamentous hemagglutinin N-terminal domain-containing protein [Halomonas sp. M5N1S17]|uniref:two-partner secretion domain-containing protein n=1 Tax=Halomonas alkalisoli TaxID=2907158 RepID=UPI001F1E823B|nr:filamentous hemagglutinin N-terminal domain-containing protein [Halomonas alkalisoli]MCE9665951.1 filamentous hemagglutinin N-terminal domain-containing protein [Halomonas alkalisoli]